MSKYLSQIGEFGLIDLIKKSAYKTRGVIKGIGDDTAVIDCGAWQWLLFTTDMMLEGIHFTRDMEPEQIGHKALACNISDVAAMGGLPTFAVISLGVSRQLDVHFIQDIYKGINKLAKQFSVSIVGGDTVASDKIIINVALLGKVKKSDLVTRAGARKGDQIFVTGPLGRSYQNKKHLSFTPRIKEAQFLVNRLKPSSMIDISDGLIADLEHILKQSKTGALIYEEYVPTAPGATLKDAICDGEDFELLFTLDPRKAERLKKMKIKDMEFFPIGEIVHKREKVRMLDCQGNQSEVEVKGFAHF